MLDKYPSISYPVSSFASQELEFFDEKYFLEKFSTGSTQTLKETHELLSGLSSCELQRVRTAQFLLKFGSKCVAAGDFSLFIEKTQCFS